MKAEQRLHELWGEICDLGSVELLLHWDRETYMPSGGQHGRGQILAMIAGLKHARLTDLQLADCLAECAEAAPAGSLLAAQVHQARRHVDRATKIPADLTRALAEAASTALGAWHEARGGGGYAAFEPALATIIRLKREEAAAISPDAGAYDSLLDEFEPGMTEGRLDLLFAELGERLTPLVQAAGDSGVVIDEEAIRGEYSRDAQLELGRWVAERIGFDFTRGRLDPSTHPFCAGLHPGDVRLTWMLRDDDVRPHLFGVLHEVGHGMYEQGLPEGWLRTPIGDAVSLGVHESQSRLWENHVGRGRPFWTAILPRFRELFPNSSIHQPDDVWPALHTVKPSLIRVEADEVTYNLHIMVRYELERDLVADRLQTADLPAAWNEAYDRRLGLRPTNDLEGVLQDIHWATGLIGYFPTYTLGTLLAAQLFATAERQLADLSSEIEAGRFEILLDWLRDRIHRHGSRHTPAALIAEATGDPLSTGPFIDYVLQNTEQIYSLPAASQS